jgi:iron complex outermembrane receptor protein
MTISRQSRGIRGFVQHTIFVLLLTGNLLGQSALPRGDYTWHAHLSDETGQPVPYANVVLSELNTGTMSDEQGHVALHNLPSGTFTVDISVIGYLNRSIQISLPQASGESLEIELHHTVLEGSTVTVTITGLPTDILNSERTVTVIEGDALLKKQGQSVSATLAEVPGVQLLSQGHAVAKPVIRGMTNQRLVLLKDGVRQEGQQWGGHHTPEADILSIGRIEVLRGPIGLIYGSEALGGVIMLQSPDLPTLGTGGRSWKVGILSGYHANSNQVMGSLGIQHSRQNSAWRINVSGRNSDDYAVPGSTRLLERQDGTAYREFNMKLHGRMALPAHEWELLASHFWEEQTLIGEGHWHNTGGGPDGNDPWFHVMGSVLSPTRHQDLTLKGKWLLDNSWLEYDLGMQDNHRQGGPAGSEPAVDLRGRTTALNLRWRHMMGKRLPGTIGLSIQDRSNRSGGTEILLPDYDQRSVGVYSYYRWMVSSLTFSGGLRLDGTEYDIHETRFTADYRVAADRKRYLPVTSGSVGLVWHEAEKPYSVSLNLGSGWRPPNPYELYIKGVHHGDWKIELGEPDLSPEVSLNTDLILRHVAGTHNGEISFFYNRIRDYISSNPTGELDRISGIPIYAIQQADARTYGAEMRLQHVMGQHWRYEIGTDLMVGELLSEVNDADGDGKVETALPAINPPRALLGLSYFRDKLLFLGDLEVELSMQHVWPQHALAEFENVLDNGTGLQIEVDPEGHQLLDFRFSAVVALGHQSVRLQLGIDNMLNQGYYDHLSRYKGIAYNSGIDFHGSIGLTL